MSIYDDALAALQRTGLTGGTLTHLEHKALLAVVRARAAEVGGVRSATDTAAADIEAQCVLIDGSTDAQVTADGAAAIRASLATLVAAKPPADTLIVNPVIDGVW
jgi:hypothetical protein